MRHFDFSPDVLNEVERDRFGHPDSRVQRRMEALWLKAHGGGNNIYTSPPAPRNRLHEQLRSPLLGQAQLPLLIALPGPRTCVDTIGERHGRIAELSGLSRATVQRVLDRYEAGGVAAVRGLPHEATAGAGGGLAVFQPTLEVSFRDRPPATVAEACDRIERLTGVRRG